MAVTKGSTAATNLVKQTANHVKRDVQVAAKEIQKDVKASVKELHKTMKSEQTKKVVDVVQTTLDLVGLVPVVGEFADGANGVIYTARGDFKNAALSYAAMIPIVGSVGTAGKLIGKGVEVVEHATDAAKTTKATAGIAAKQVEVGAKATAGSGKIKLPSNQVNPHNTTAVKDVSDVGVKGTDNNRPSWR